MSLKVEHVKRVRRILKMREFGAILVGISAVLLLIALFGHNWLERKGIWTKFAIIALACNLISLCIALPILLLT